MAQLAALLPQHSYCSAVGSNVQQEAAEAARLGALCSGSAAQAPQEGFHSLVRSSLSYTSLSCCNPTRSEGSHGHSILPGTSSGTGNALSPEHRVLSKSCQRNSRSCTGALPQQPHLCCQGQKQSCAEPRQGPPLTARAGQNLQAPGCHPGEHLHCSDWSLPFPVGGAHPQSSHHRLDPSCKERHCEVTSPGATDRDSASHGTQLPASTSAASATTGIRGHCAAHPCLLPSLHCVPLGQLPGGQNIWGLFNKQLLAHSSPHHRAELGLPAGSWGHSAPPALPALQQQEL